MNETTTAHRWNRSPAERLISVDLYFHLSIGYIYMLYAALRIETWGSCKIRWISTPKLILNQFLWYLGYHWLISQVPTRFKISHRARQRKCHALDKISKQLINLNESCEQTKFKLKMSFGWISYITQPPTIHGCADPFHDRAYFKSYVYNSCFVAFCCDLVPVAFALIRLGYFMGTRAILQCS